MNHLQFLELQHLNAIVSLFFNDIVTGITATADANGNWSISFLPLHDQTMVISANQNLNGVITSSNSITVTWDVP